MTYEFTLLYVMHKRGLCRRAASVRLGFRHARVLCRNQQTYSSFSTSGIHTFLVFPHQTVWQYSDGDITNGGMNKSRFSTNTSLYLGSDTRSVHSYYETPVGARMRSIERCQFQ